MVIYSKQHGQRAESMLGGQLQETKKGFLVLEIMILE
jgi:hypothetical protein